MLSAFFQRVGVLFVERSTEKLAQRKFRIFVLRQTGGMSRKIEVLAKAVHKACWDSCQKELSPHKEVSRLLALVCFKCFLDVIGMLKFSGRFLCEQPEELFRKRGCGAFMDKAQIGQLAIRRSPLQHGMPWLYVGEADIRQTGKML